jgi:hypothetical protein
MTDLPPLAGEVGGQLGPAVEDNGPALRPGVLVPTQAAGIVEGCRLQHDEAMVAVDMPVFGAVG